MWVCVCVCVCVCTWGNVIWLGDLQSTCSSSITNLHERVACYNIIYNYVCMCSSPSVGRSVLGTIGPWELLTGVHVCPNDLTTITRRRSGAHQVALSTAMAPVTAHSSDCSKTPPPPVTTLNEPGCHTNTSPQCSLTWWQQLVACTQKWGGHNYRHHTVVKARQTQR